MPHTIKLPDAMPAIDRPTLLVVCDSHHALLYDVGGHTMLMKEEIASTEHTSSDRQSSKPTGKGGHVVGVGENSQVEEHRLHEFANTLLARIASIVASQKIDVVHLSAPSKFLSQLKKSLPKALATHLQSQIDGNFVKEAPLQTLARFRPDLHRAMQDLRDQENYSTSKHLPK